MRALALLIVVPVDAYRLPGHLIAHPVATQSRRHAYATLQEKGDLFGAISSAFSKSLDSSSSSPPEDDTIKLSLTKPLGIVLEELEDGGAYVADITRGSAKENGIQLGDVLVAVNGRDVLSLPFDLVMDTLRSAPTQLTLEVSRAEEIVEGDAPAPAAPAAPFANPFGSLPNPFAPQATEEEEAPPPPPPSPPPAPAPPTLSNPFDSINPFASREAPPSAPPPPEAQVAPAVPPQVRSSKRGASSTIAMHHSRLKAAAVLYTPSTGT